MGGVDIDLDVPPSCYPANPAKLLPDSLWNGQNDSHPNLGTQPPESPCILYAVKGMCLNFPKISPNSILNSSICGVQSLILAWYLINSEIEPRLRGHNQTVDGTYNHGRRQFIV